MEKDKVTRTVDIEVDLGESNDVPPSIRYAEMTIDELDAEIEHELERCSSLRSWDEAAAVA